MSKLILVIEDEGVIQRVIRAFLENEGYQVILAEDGLEGIGLFREQQPDQSRNRNSGGSGPGLYITKMILEHHGIDCCMENTEAGVRFTAILSRMVDKDMLK